MSKKEVITDVNKIKRAFWIHPEVDRMLTAHVASGEFQSRSDLVEKAVRFYCGTLNAKTDQSFLGEQIVGSVQSIIDEFGGRVFSHLRSEDIHISLIYELLATGFSDVDEATIKQLRKQAAQYVDEHLKARSFEAAYKREKNAGMIRDAETDR